MHVCACMWRSGTCMGVAQPWHLPRAADRCCRVCPLPSPPPPAGTLTLPSPGAPSSSTTSHAPPPCPTSARVSERGPVRGARSHRLHCARVPAAPRHALHMPCPCTWRPALRIAVWVGGRCSSAGSHTWLRAQGTRVGVPIGAAAIPNHAMAVLPTPPPAVLPAWPAVPVVVPAVAPSSEELNSVAVQVGPRAPPDRGTAKAYAAIMGVGPADPSMPSSTLIMRDDALTDPHHA